MESLYLIKYGELTLKGDNRIHFEERLCSDIKKKLEGFDIRLIRRWGRLYLHASDKIDIRIEKTLSNTMGIIAFTKALKVKKEMKAIERAACKLAERCIISGNRFKVEARRTDKSFPQNSYNIACCLGDVLRSRFPELKADMSHPDWILNVEIREAAYLYGKEIKAPGGLPLGSSGRGLLLLSGGIDSPVAGYLMGKRGLKIHAAYFHTPPFTSEKAKEKVEHLSEILSEYLTEFRLNVVHFTDIQTRINERAQPEEITLLMRACMVKISELIALKQGCLCLITGESLGQVASQTAQSIRFTGSLSALPIFRPLIGMDKEEIITLARKIDTYDTSILPYQDCCTLFSPPHPLVKPKYEHMIRAFKRLEIEDLIRKASQNV